MKVKSLSRVRLLATPWTAVYQAPPSMGFSRQEYWSGLPLLSPRFAWLGEYSFLFSQKSLFLTMYWIISLWRKEALGSEHGGVIITVCFCNFLQKFVIIYKFCCFIILYHCCFFFSQRLQVLWKQGLYHILLCQDT